MSLDVFLVRTNYNELLRKIDELKKVDKGFQNKLREIVVTLRDVSDACMQLSLTALAHLPSMAEYATK